MSCTGEEMYMLSLKEKARYQMEIDAVHCTSVHASYLQRQGEKGSEREREVDE